ncbi:MAG: HAD family hydrolase [Oscillospiraceae bacterium]|nr:HAD family hydrolase [Oscillospiraceae bacterium]
MKYRHCIFDLYGTLVDIRTDERSPRLWARMAELYRRNGAACRPEELRDGYFRLVRELEGANPLRQDAHEAHPEIQIEQVFRGLYAQKGVEAGDELVRRTGLAFREHSTEYLRLYEGAAELLRLLRARGCGVWLLSNAQSLFTRWELERLGLDGSFDGVYLSSDYGCKKPDPRFFQALLRERGIRPEEAVMIGNDGVCDIQGAKAVGLAAVYIRSNLSPDEPLPDADHVLEELDLRRVGDLLTGGGPA